MKKFNLLMTIMLVFGMMANCGKAKESKMDEKSSGAPESDGDNPRTEVAVISTKFGEIVLEFFIRNIESHFTRNCNSHVKFQSHTYINTNSHFSR